MLLIWIIKLDGYLKKGLLLAIATRLVCKWKYIKQLMSPETYRSSGRKYSTTETGNSFEFICMYAISIIHTINCTLIIINTLIKNKLYL